MGDSNRGRARARTTRDGEGATCKIGDIVSLFKRGEDNSMVVTNVHIPEDLVEALDSGELSQAQLRQLIGIEAAALGMSFSDAVAGARENTLPKDPIGSDLRFLVRMLEDEAVAAD